MERSASDLPVHIRRSRGPGDRPVVEIHHLWGSVLLDTRHFGSDVSTISVGNEIGYRWRFLGVDMGWVPRSLRHVVAWAAPIWSEVEAQGRSDFTVEPELLDGAPSHSLVERTAKGWIVSIPRGWAAHGDRSGQPARLDGSSVLLTEDLEVRLTRGSQTLVVRLAAAEKRVERGRSSSDPVLLLTSSIAAFCGLLFALIVASTPSRPVNTVVDVPDHFVQKLLVKPDKPVEKPLPTKRKADRTRSDKPPGAEGRRGRKEGTRGKAAGAHRKRLDREIVDQSGLVGALRALGETNGVLGSSQLDNDLTRGIGRLTGPSGVQIGEGGLADRGNGPGGGGSTDGVGTDLGTRGLGGGDRDYGRVEDLDKGQAEIVEPDEPVVIGLYPRSHIKDVILAHLPHFRYCYQRRLQLDPSLSGEVVVKFSIVEDGSVSTTRISSSTLSDTAVGQCVERRILKLTFPRPKRGVVVVSYPFLFAPPS